MSKNDADEAVSDVLELTALKSAGPYEHALWEHYRKDDIKVITQKECQT
jgi:hypothetical protein